MYTTPRCLVHITKLRNITSVGLSQISPDVILRNLKSVQGKCRELRLTKLKRGYNIKTALTLLGLGGESGVEVQGGACRSLEGVEEAL